MNRLLFVLIIILLSGLTIKPAFSAVNSAMLKSSNLIADNRIIILEQFLNKYESPLVPYAKEFILAADYYEIDWRLIPAITGIESGFGKRIPYNSYNAYGWNNGNFRFSSWNNSIWHVARVLKNKYISRGAQTIPQIAKIYAPPSTTWSNGVSFFVKKLNSSTLLAFNL